MTTSNYAYVRFLNLMRALQKGKHIGDYHPQAIAILAWISENVASNQMITITNLVNRQDFGSLPTVLRRLAELQKAGLITYGSCSDRRLKSVVLTQSGEMLLKSYSEAMAKAVLDPAAPKMSNSPTWCSSNGDEALDTAT